MSPSDRDTPPTSDSAAERPVELVDYSAGNPVPRRDAVVVEEPMEIRVVYGAADQRKMRSVSITMRTPGSDQELAAGFLFTESLLASPNQIARIETRGVDASGGATGNIVRVDLKPDVAIDLGSLQRHFFTTSSCGVCGKASLEALTAQGLTRIQGDRFVIAASRVKQLPDRLRARQATFHRTGGLHAAGLVTAEGDLVAVREDVGRHNAVDKLLGRCFLDGETPLGQYAMIVSGRVSFEIMQKALVAGIPLVIAVGAPSSLAIDVAAEYHMTLIGFTSSKRFNLYAGAERVSSAADVPRAN
jgi:FdhD protein